MKTFISLLSLLFLQFCLCSCDLQLNYYAESCPRAEEIIREQVTQLHEKQYHTAISWLRNLFHDCMVKSCDASILLDNAKGVVSEKNSPRSFGMRNFKFINTIKSAVEKECPEIVSCADIVALSARDGVVLLKGPYVEMKTGRRDSRVSFAEEVESFLPNVDDDMSLVLDRFNSTGLDTEAMVALLGAHSVGRVHCTNIVGRLYPTVDPSLTAARSEYLKRRCPTAVPDPKIVQYSRTDLVTPAVLDNLYYQSILRGDGVLSVDEELATDNRTSPFVEKMAGDNDYFHQQFANALLIMSENNPLVGDQGEIRKDCRFVNKY